MNFQGDGRLSLKEKLERRFMPEPNPGCWIWLSALNDRGYGQFSKKHAHRVTYETFVGPIPEGLVLDHLCRVPCCVNPAHLEPVTHKENILRGVGIAAVNATKTQCKNGHELSGENLGTQGGGKHRRCLLCQEAAISRWKAQGSERRLTKQDRLVLAELAGLENPVSSTVLAERCNLRTYSPRETAARHAIRLASLGLAEKLGTTREPQWQITDAGRSALHSIRED